MKEHCDEYGFFSVMDTIAIVLVNSEYYNIVIIDESKEEEILHLIKNNQSITDDIIKHIHNLEDGIIKCSNSSCTLNPYHKESSFFLEKNAQLRRSACTKSRNAAIAKNVPLNQSCIICKKSSLEVNILKYR